MLENISVKLTAIYEKYIPLSEIDHLKMILGFQNILHQTGLFVIIFMISALFGIFEETLLFTLIFSSFRCLSGGFHLNTSIGCICITTLIHIGGVWLALSVNLIPASTFLSLICVLILTLIRAPQRTKNYSVTPQKRLRLKILSALFVVICTFSALLCSAPIRELIVFAAASQALTLIPDAGHPHHPRPH